MTPTTAPAMLDGRPKIMVAVKTFSIILVTILSNWHKSKKIESIIRKAITSYTIIFKTDTPLNIPPKLKNGKCSYKKFDTGPFSKKANITDRIKPKAETNSLNTPLLKPSKAPNTKKIIIKISTILIFYHTSLLKLYYKFS